MAISAPRGVRDILPEESERWRWLEDTFVHVCQLFGYHELRIPYFEATELYQRGVGEATDIVQKEMYTFNDRSDRSLTLRPEITAGMVRAFIEQKLHAGSQPVKLFTYGPLFRYERPQAGRYRQFHQFDIEIFGSSHPLADAEVIAVGMELFRRVGLKNIEVQLNSIGCADCRPVHRQAMLAYLEERLSKLCADCQKRYSLNPLRVFDCKNESCQGELTELPLIKDYLCPDCRDHYQKVIAFLGDFEIPYIQNDRLVRGLDYYNRTVFEYYAPDVREIGALGGGGRYDPLVEVIGGPSTPGVGFGLGIERILIAITQSGNQPSRPELDLFLAVLGETATHSALQIADRLRREEISCEVDLLQRGLKAQMRQADRLNARFVAILGDDEIARGQVLLRNMKSKEQQSVALNDLPQLLKSDLGYRNP